MTDISSPRTSGTAGRDGPWWHRTLDYDPQLGSFVTTCQPSESPTHVVVTSVAMAVDEEPIELPPLASYLDPDALDTLFDTDSPVEGHVTFLYAGCEVQFWNDGTVVVTPPEERSSQSLN